MESSSQFRTAGPLRARQRRLRGGVQRGEGARLRRTARSARRPRRTSLVGGRARPSRAGTPSRATWSTRKGLDVARQRPSLRDAEPERGRRGDQLLERQVPLGLLAAVERDPRAAEDGNPATEPDPTWTALITAPYPDHPSGHLCLDGAHIGVLRMFFGDVIEGGYQITSASTFLLPADPATRTLLQLLAGARGDHRGPHLGRPPLPHRRRAGRKPREERRRIRGGELLPAGGPR